MVFLLFLLKQQRIIIIEQLQVFVQILIIMEEIWGLLVTLSSFLIEVCFFHIKAEGANAEELELELIDFGAEEIEIDENQIIITASFESFGGLQKQLENGS